MQSCYRAWEYLGFIAEKEQLFKEAAERYEKAWHFSHQRNPSIGEPLARLSVGVGIGMAGSACHGAGQFI